MRDDFHPLLNVGRDWLFECRCMTDVVQGWMCYPSVDFEFKIQRFVPQKTRACKPCLSRGVLQCIDLKMERKESLFKKKEKVLCVISCALSSFWCCHMSLRVSGCAMSLGEALRLARVSC